MDSLTQAALGAGIAGAIAPSGQRRKALIVGAVLGTLPDLDVLIDYGGAVENLTYHRGFSHSLFVLTPLSVLLWLALARLWAATREAPLRWLAAISLALITHPLLDAHTAYGTQLLWPLPVHPTMWGTVFIIDPLFTLPLVVATLATATFPLRAWSTALLRLAVALSCIYLAWTWLAQAIVHRHAERVLATINLQDAPIFVTPTPFNTLLWRVVVQTEQGYMEGFDSLLLDEPAIEFTSYPSNWAALREASDVWAVARLRWFSNDFLKAEVEDRKLLLSDLRMGQEPVYVFKHVVAERDNPHWREVATELVPTRLDGRAVLTSLQRIWTH